jgi:hypothetical protein
VSEPSHQTVRLSKGRHKSPRDGACVMELASMLADEGFSDHPDGACPVIAGFLRGYNDCVDDERRQDLYAYASEVVGSRGGGLVTARRKRLVRRWVRGLDQRRWAGLSVRLAFIAGPVDPLGGYVGHLVATCRDRSEAHRLHSEVLSLVDGMLALGDAPGAAELEPPCADAGARRDPAPV